LKKNFIKYFLSNLFAKGIGFYITIYVTKYISPDLYGIIYYYISLASIVISLTMMGLPGLIFTNYIGLSKIERDILERKIYSYLVSVSIVILFFLIILCFFKCDILYIFLFIFIISNYFMHLEINLLRIFNRINELVIINLLYPLFSFFIVYFFLKENPFILIIIIAIPNILYTIYFFYERIKKNFKFFNLIFPTTKEFKISIPIMFTSFIFLFYNFINKQFILLFLNKTFLGIYEMSFKFGILIDVLLMQVINTIITPILLKKFKKDEKEGKKLVLRLSLLTIILGSIVFILPKSIQDIPKYFIDFSYYESVKYIKYIVFQFFLLEAINLINNSFMYKKKTYVIALTWIIIVGLNIIISYFLIFSYGLYGLLYANILSLFIGFIILTILMLKVKFV
jgi:O-antigen/teichoic acid export membrane protein